LRTRTRSASVGTRREENGSEEQGDESTHDSNSVEADPSTISVRSKTGSKKFVAKLVNMNSVPTPPSKNHSINIRTLTEGTDSQSPNQVLSSPDRATSLPEGNLPSPAERNDIVDGMSGETEIQTKEKKEENDNSTAKINDPRKNNVREIEKNSLEKREKGIKSFEERLNETFDLRQDESKLRKRIISGRNLLKRPKKSRIIAEMKDMVSLHVRMVAAEIRHKVLKSKYILTI